MVYSYKVMITHPGYEILKEGDEVELTLKRPLFYVYWTIDDYKKNSYIAIEDK